jgi:uncharacterized protein (TIRG00374 family)
MSLVKKRTIQIIVTLLLSAAALYVALKGVDFTTVGYALSQVHWGWLFLTFILILVTLFIRAQRWRVLLDNQISWRDSFGLINIGYLISGVLPLRAGDPARAVGANLRGSVTILAALSTVVVERVLDLFIMFILLLSTLPFVPGLRLYLTTGQANTLFSYQFLLFISGILAFSMLVIFVLLALMPAKVEKIVRIVLEFFRFKNPDRWLKPVNNVLHGFSALRSPQAGLSVILWSLALWLVTALYFAAGMQACRAFIPESSLLRGTVAMWASAFGMVFPATGGIGSFHFAVREALKWGFDVPRDMGFAYAVIVHAIPYVLGIILGTVSVLVWGISIRSLIGLDEESGDS